MKKLIIDEESLKTLLREYMDWGSSWDYGMATPDFNIEEVQEIAKAKDFSIEVKEE